MFEASKILKMFADREPVEKPSLLRRDAHQFLRIGRFRNCVDAHYPDRARRRSQFRRQLAKKGGFSSAVRSENRADLARLYAETNSSIRFGAVAIRLNEIANFNRECLGRRKTLIRIEIDFFGPALNNRSHFSV